MKEISMPDDTYQDRTSRRAFLGAAAAGAASLTASAVDGQAAEAKADRPARSTVRDRLWLFCVQAGLDNNSFEKADFRGGSRMTPAEGAFYLNVPNLLMIRSSNLPRLPSAETWRTKTSFQQYAISFTPLDRVVWSVIGSGGHGSLHETNHVLALAKEFPNISGIYLDDFIRPERQPDGRYVGRPALSPDELKQARDKLKTAGRPMDVWVTLYRHHLVPKHPHHVPYDPPLASFIDSFDVPCLWTWNADELPQLEETLATLEAVATKKRRIALGLYMWDYPNKRPVPLELMQLQCEQGLKWLKEGRVQELVFLGNTMLDLGAPSGEFSREWIAKVGAQPL